MSEVNLLEQEPQGTDTPEVTAETGKPAGLPDKFWNPENNVVRLDDLIKSYCALEKKLGSGFSMPDDDEGRMKILQALGMPESPDGYDVKMKNDLLAVDTDVNK